ncbi:hypothetical protein [Flagellimonas sp. 2504JD1-5]
MKNKILTFFLAIGFVAMAQKEAKCVVTTQNGSEISGYVKKYNSFYTMAKGFDLYKGERKIHFKPDSLDKVVVNDTIVYRPMINKKGREYLMEILNEGTPLSLYRYRTRMSGNIPGEGYSVWIYQEYYIKVGERIIFVDEKKLRNNPGAFFPNAPTLQASIKATKRRDMNIPNWVKQYNEIMASQ